MARRCRIIHGRLDIHGRHQETAVGSRADAGAATLCGAEGFCEEAIATLLFRGPDVVIELSAAELGPSLASPDPFFRRLTVVKNRFGPSDPGPHRFALRAGQGATVYPTATSYLRPWAVRVLLGLAPDTPASRSEWGQFATSLSSMRGQASGVSPAVDDTPPFNECVTLLYGDSRYPVALVAGSLGASPSSVDILVSISRAAEPWRTSPSSSSLKVVPVGSPEIGADQLVYEAATVVGGVLRTGGSVGRVLIVEPKRARELMKRALELMQLS